MTVGSKTVIHTLSGDRFAEDLAGEEPFYGFTWDGDRVTVGKFIVDGPRLQIPLRVMLDDTSVVYVADGMSMLRRDGERELVRNLEDRDSLLPLYMKIDRDGYPLYREPGDWHRGALTRRDSESWRRISRMVAEWKLGRRCAPGDRVSFADKRRSNCRPDNLVITHKTPKPRQQKADFAEPIFEAARIIERFNHKIENIDVDISREMFSIKGLDADIIALSGIFMTVDSE